MRASPAGMPLSLLLAVLVAGCDGDNSNEAENNAEAQSAGTVNAGSGQAKADGQSSPEHKEEPIPDGFCENWPKPAVVFAVTGQVHGYLEPCGCSEPQFGGFSRRADLLQQIEKRGWPVVPLDLGDTLKRTREQSQHKFDTLQSAQTEMNYVGQGVGTSELQQGLDWLISQLAQEDNVPFVCANVRVLDDPSLSPKPFVIAERGGMKIGVTAIFSPTLVPKVGALDEAIKVTDPIEALRQAVAGMQEQGASLLVLMSHCPPKETAELAKSFPEFPVIFSTGPSSDPFGDNPQEAGSTKIVYVGHKGRYVGVVGYYPNDDDKVRFELVRLDGKRFADPPKMLDHMRFYQQLLQDRKLAEVHDENAVPHKQNAEYVGAERCGECHEKAYNKWKTTGHADGFASLETGRRGISRIHDPECLSCHVTGWHPQEVFRYTTGYFNRQKSAHLLGNQCENCHGPGSRHISLIETGLRDEAVALVRVTQEQAKKTLCVSCHDQDNSPHFKWDDYWPRIAHPWRD